MNIFTGLLISAVTAGASYLALNKKKPKHKPVKADKKNLETSSDFYFNISNFSLKGAKINNLDKDRFFYCYLKPDLKYYCTEIKLEGNLGKLARMIYAEASPGAKNLKCKIAVGEVIRNRLYSNIYIKEENIKITLT